MVSLPRHFVPNPVLLHSTRRGVKRPESLFLHTRYDAAGELTGASDPASANYIFTPDYDGNNTSSTAAYAGLTVNGSSPNLTLEKSYDANGYLTDLYAYVGDTADFHNSYTYDHDGDVTSITQQANADNAGNYPGCNSHNSVSGKYVSFIYDDDRKSGPGGPGRFPARGSHRPERAQLTHSVPQVIPSLRRGTPSGSTADTAGDNARATG